MHIRITSHLIHGCREENSTAGPLPRGDSEGALPAVLRRHQVDRRLPPQEIAARAPSAELPRRPAELARLHRGLLRRRLVVLALEDGELEIAGVEDDEPEPDGVGDLEVDQRRRVLRGRRRSEGGKVHRELLPPAADGKAGLSRAQILQGEELGEDCFGLIMCSDW